MSHIVKRIGFGFIAAIILSDLSQRLFIDHHALAQNDKFGFMLF